MPFRAITSVIPPSKPSGGITRAICCRQTVADSGSSLRSFRQAVVRDAAKTTTWDVRDLYLAHLALSDISGGRFYHTERTNRSGPGIAGADEARSASGMEIGNHLERCRSATTSHCRRFRATFRATFGKAAGHSRRERHQPESGRPRPRL